MLSLVHELIPLLLTRGLKPHTTSTHFGLKALHSFKKLDLKFIDSEAHMSKPYSLWDDIIECSKKGLEWKRSISIDNAISNGGIPNNYRHSIWQIVSGSISIHLKNKGIFDLLKNRKSNSNNKIVKDLIRTYPTHPFFISSNRTILSAGQQSLKDLLHSYSCLHPEIGYVQGMNYIAAHILIVFCYISDGSDLSTKSPVIDRSIITNYAVPKTEIKSVTAPCGNLLIENYFTDSHVLSNSPSITTPDISPKIYKGVNNLPIHSKISEESAFWLFATIMNKIRSIHLSGVPGYNLCVETFDSIISKLLPDLYHILSKHDITARKYAQPWFLSLFCYPTIPLSFSTHIWDFYLLMNLSMEIFFRVGYTIMYHISPYILELEAKPEEIMPFLTSACALNTQLLSTIFSHAPTRSSPKQGHIRRTTMIHDDYHEEFAFILLQKALKYSFSDEIIDLIKSLDKNISTITS